MNIDEQIADVTNPRKNTAESNKFLKIVNGKVKLSLLIEFYRVVRSGSEVFLSQNEFSISFVTLKLLSHTLKP